MLFKEILIKSFLLCTWLTSVKPYFTTRILHYLFLTLGWLLLFSCFIYVFVKSVNFYLEFPYLKVNSSKIIFKKFRSPWTYCLPVVQKGPFLGGCPEYNFREEPFTTCLYLLVIFPDLIGYTYWILDLIGFTSLQLKTPLNSFS